jgi:curved DNA-binding protein CbpA
MSYYETLGINVNATHEEIRSAYKKKSFNIHPDRNYIHAKRAVEYAI